MASPRNIAESYKPIEESQGMTCCPIPPPPTDSSPLRSPFPWPPTDSIWSTSYIPQSPTYISQSSTDFLQLSTDVPQSPTWPFSPLWPQSPSSNSIVAYLGPNQSMESPPQFQQHQDIVDPTPAFQDKMIFSVRMRLQNLPLLPQKLLGIFPPQQQRKWHRSPCLLQLEEQLSLQQPQLELLLKLLLDQLFKKLDFLFEMLLYSLFGEPDSLFEQLDPEQLLISPQQLWQQLLQLPQLQQLQLLQELLQQDTSDALNLSPTSINMVINRMEHNNWGLFSTTRTKLYIGIWRRQGGEWVAKLRHHRKWLHIGTLNNAMEAAIAHDQAAYSSRGRRAQINFPELVDVISSSFLDENQGEPTTAPIMEILPLPAQQEDNPNEDTVLGRSEASENDEIAAVGIEAQGTGEDEMAKVGLNSGCLEVRKRKAKTAAGERETKKTGVKITIPLEDILQNREVSLQDAARNLNADLRAYRDYNISRWSAREINKLISYSFPTETPMDNIDQEKIPQSSSDIPPPIQVSTSGDTNSVIVKARYENGIPIKFRLSLPWRRVELQQEVERRLPLEPGTYNIMYKDEEDELILIACDEDLEEYISTSILMGTNSIVVFLGPK